MPDPLSQLQKLTNFLDKSVEDFSKDLPGVQDKIFDRVQVLLRDLELSRGSVKASVKNLRKINRIKREIEDIVYSAKYFKDVDYFTNAFDISTDLQTGYFQTMEKNFTTPKFIEVLKKSTMESTKVALTEAGIQANVVDKAAEIIQTNISQGRKFGNMVTDMRNFLVTTPEHVGALKSYASHIVRDSINTYAAQYNQYVSDDLDFQWFVYTGALVKTSRSFCVKLVKKQYVHKSEFGKVAAGNFIPKPLNMKGLKPDTKATNLQILRGGYNCNHLLSPIGEAWVPKKLRLKYEDIS